jgi:hypothetical protein
MTITAAMLERVGLRKIGRRMYVNAIAAKTTMTPLINASSSVALLIDVVYAAITGASAARTGARHKKTWPATVLFLKLLTMVRYRFACLINNAEQRAESSTLMTNECGAKRRHSIARGLRKAACVVTAKIGAFSAMFPVKSIREYAEYRAKRSIVI